MSYQKVKFHEPTQAEKNQEKIMSDIWQQEKNISLLLEKYKDLMPDRSASEQLQKQSMSSIKMKINVDEHSKAKKSKHASLKSKSVTLNHENHNQLQLPALPRLKKFKNATQLKTDSVSVPISVPKSKSILRTGAYEENLVESNITIINSAHQEPSVRKITRAPNKNKSEIASNVKQSKEQKQQNMPAPILYKRLQNLKREEGENGSDSDLQTNEVPLKYYEGQFQKMLEEQCKQEMNFLFFSANSEMKQWSQEILELFSKHDQALSRLHKKNKLLEQFDKNYFTSNAYKYD